jgi:glutathione S-transferase
MTKPRLITIPISHFCEKARWALDYANISYTEDRYLQGFHVIGVRRAGGRWTTPILVLDSKTLYQSTDIVRWVDTQLPEESRLFPKEHEQEVSDLVLQFDKELGPASRRWVYHHILPNKQMVLKGSGVGTPIWQRAALQLAYPFVAKRIIQRFKITNETAEQSEALCMKVFDQVSERLQDGRSYLCGNRFTAADLTFAALSAPVLLPPQYAVPMPKMAELPQPMAKTVERFQSSRAGKWALGLYQSKR